VDANIVNLNRDLGYVWSAVDAPVHELIWAGLPTARSYLEALRFFVRAEALCAGAEDEEALAALLPE
jgi:transposase-like protein